MYILKLLRNNKKEKRKRRAGFGPLDHKFVILVVDNMLTKIFL